MVPDDGSGLVLIQMTTPAWYPSSIMHHLADRRRDQATHILIASPDCDAIAFHLLREKRRLIKQFFEVSRKPIEIPSEISRMYKPILLSFCTVQETSRRWIAAVFQKFRTILIALYSTNPSGKMECLQRVLTVCEKYFLHQVNSHLRIGLTCDSGPETGRTWLAVQ